VDHIAAYMMGAYDAPQVGDMHSVDWAEPFTVKSVAQYSVWADLDPEDAVLAGRDPKLRANTLMLASQDVEQTVIEGIMKYPSQMAIIDSLIQARSARKLDDGRFMEVYLRFDPRPKLSFEPYKEFVESL